MITLNIFDATFAHAPISTAFQESQYINYVRNQMKWSGVTVFTDGFISSPVVDQVETDIRVAWLHEPPCLHPQDYENALPHLHKFDKVITYYQPILDEFPNAVLGIYAGVWIPKTEWRVHPKTKKVSMLYGSKMATEGHRIRHDIAQQIGDYYGVDYYGYRGTPTDYGPQTKLMVLRDYRFSIVGETCREPNLFTEILLDCFAVGTVPIFWGCPNLDRFFNAEGILNINDLRDLRYIMPQLSDGLYRELLPAVRDNAERVKEYAVCEDWLYLNVFKEYV